MLPIHGYEAKEELERAVSAALEPLGASSVGFEYSVNVPAWEGTGQQAAIAGVKAVIAVASNKGGVGKSTIASNLAVSLAASGASVGLIDAGRDGAESADDVRGCRPGFQQQSEQGLHPVERFGVKVISLGFLLPAGAPVVWRGPMIGSAVRQLLHDVEWGEVDYLLVDLPPGTSDASMSLAQDAPLAGAVIVSTPQQVALEDASKAVAMFEKLEVPVFGIVENMSYFVAPGDGRAARDFRTRGSGGGGRGFGSRFSGRGAAGRRKCGRAGTGDARSWRRSREHPAALAFSSLAARVAVKAAAGALLQPPRLDVPVMAAPHPQGAPGQHGGPAPGPGPAGGGGQAERPKVDHLIRCLG